MKRELNSRRKTLLILISLLLVLSLLSAAFIYLSLKNGSSIKSLLPKDGVSFVFLSVEQASCTMIFTDGGVLFIDTGSNSSENTVLSACAYYGVQEIEAILLTHADEDHSGGLDALLRSYPVKSVILTDLAYTELSECYEGIALREAVSAEQCSLQLTTKGDVFSFGEAALRVLVPSEYEAALLGDGNEASLILLLEFRETRALFTGDAGEKGELLAISELVATSPSASYDLLLVGHHGSATSSCKSFIEYISPRFSVISCGEDNTYGHPNITVLERLRAVGSTILRTDREGSVILHSDGKVMKRIKR